MSSGWEECINYTSAGMHEGRLARHGTIPQNVFQGFKISAEVRVSGFLLVMYS